MYVAVLSSGYLFHPSHGIVHGAPSLIIWKGQGSKKLQTNEQKVESSLSMTCTRHSERKRAIWCGGWHLPQNADLLAFAGTWPYGRSHPLPNAWSFPSAFFFFFFSWLTLEGEQTAKDLLTLKKSRRHETNKQNNPPKAWRWREQRWTHKQTVISTLHPESESGG